MKTWITALTLILATAQAHAAYPAPVEKAVRDLKTKDVRTVVTKTKHEGACEGDYKVELQVKQPVFNGETLQTTYRWETVKTIAVENDGSVMDVCAE